MAKGAAGSSDGESDAEDNAQAFGAAFNKAAKPVPKQKAAKKSKGGLFASLFGGSKSKGSSSREAANDININQAEEAMFAAPSRQMAMP